MKFTAPQLRDLAHYAEKLREIEDGATELNLRPEIEAIDAEAQCSLGVFTDDEGSISGWEFEPFAEAKLI